MFIKLILLLRQNSEKQDDMGKRFVIVWFPYLCTDWFALRRPELSGVPFVLSTPSHGRMIITSVNPPAQHAGIAEGMAVADARALIPSLQVFDDIPGLPGKLLKRLADWCIRFTPFASVDLPDGLILDVSGCPHIWGGDLPYLEEITGRLKKRGYHVRAAMTDTIGSAWAIARYASNSLITAKGKHIPALLPLPPQSLRLETETVERLHKLGLHQISDFIGMPRAALRRRFGLSFIKRLNQALGHEEETVQPIVPIEPYQERLPCLEPIVTATGIEIGLQQLLDTLCARLQREGKGLRKAIFKCFRTDGKMVQAEIGTNRPTCNTRHLFKLFEIKISSIEPACGIELFVLEAPVTEDHTPEQEKIWQNTCTIQNPELSELLDRVAGKIGTACIRRYLPAEHYWPERSVKQASSTSETPDTAWRTDKPRPMHLLVKPEPVEVTAPIPDYPPMLFRYKEKLHKIMKADGPERIEQEWWLQEGQHRDYYYVEDENGNRYWLFRSGHYDAARSYQWFIHGFFS